MFDSLDVGRNGKKALKNDTKNSGLCKRARVTKQENRVKEMF